jgi:hypothetical protein
MRSGVWTVCLVRPQLTRTGMRADSGPPSLDDNSANTRARARPRGAMLFDATTR